MTRRIVLVGVLGVQILCAVFYLLSILSTITGYAQFSWQVHELIEVGAVLGLILGIAITSIVIRRTMQHYGVMESQLRAASGAFMDVLEDHFSNWDLTPAERDVALFAIKGLTTAEMARLRGVSEGTIKAQTNAIYRKAGVSGRPQLLSIFIDDLMDDALVPQTSPSSVA